MFLTPNNYITSANLTSITLSIVISETSYYIQNVQSPIARLSEVVFRTLLFSILCLELSALVFLIVKLLIIPLYNKIRRMRCFEKNNKTAPIGDEMVHHHP
jgi:hypothetical protein